MLEKVLIGILMKLLKVGWDFASDQYRDKLAEKRIKAHVKDLIAQYEKLILKYDDLHDKGELTDDKKEALRQEKIRLEEGLLNGIHTSR